MSGCFSGSQSSCSANLMKSHSGFIHHLVLFVFSSNSARKRTKGFSTDSSGRCQWSTSRSLCCIYWPHRSPLVPFQLPPVISHFNSLAHWLHLTNKIPRVSRCHTACSVFVSHVYLLLVAFCFAFLITACNCFVVLPLYSLLDWLNWMCNEVKTLRSQSVTRQRSRR